MKVLLQNYHDDDLAQACGSLNMSEVDVSSGCVGIDVSKSSAMEV